MSRLGVIAVACAVLLAGCTGADAGASHSPNPAAASGRVTVPDAVVEFPRTLQAARMVEALVTTNGDAGALVTSARLDSPLFADSPARDGEIRLFPDWTNHVRMFLGTAVCPAPAGPSHAVLTMTVDGRETTETLTVTDTALREINADECAQKAILDVAAPSFGVIETHTDAELLTSIVLTRGGSRPEEPVTLTSMTGNIVFIVSLADEPRTLFTGQAGVQVPAVIKVGRCDPHVFADGKKNFVFPLYLAIGDDEPAYLEIQPYPDMKAALQNLMSKCGDVQREDGGAA
ncbi:MAG: hypothetical protein NVV57_05975 [Demequina sp.]|nr:hypothetical protein [Demequina sp.]